MKHPKLLLIACVAASGCASPRPPTDVYGSIRKCGLVGKLRVEQSGEREFKIVYLNPDTDYEKLDCFLAEAKRLRVHLRFTGNEALAPQ